MAIYERADQARELILDVARLNNGAIDTINRIVAIRAKLVALTVAERDEVVAAVTDMGYDPTEIQTILGRWNNVKATADAQGCVAVKIPRG